MMSYCSSGYKCSCFYWGLTESGRDPYKDAHEIPCNSRSGLEHCGLILISFLDVELGSTLVGNDLGGKVSVHGFSFLDLDLEV